MVVTMRSIRIFVRKNDMINFTIIFTVIILLRNTRFVAPSGPFFACVNKKRRAKKTQREKNGTLDIVPVFGY